jgi:hypothetical protein
VDASRYSCEGGRVFRSGSKSEGEGVLVGIGRGVGVGVAVDVGGRIVGDGVAAEVSKVWILLNATREAVRTLGAQPLRTSHKVRKIQSGFFNRPGIVIYLQP